MNIINRVPCALCRPVLIGIGLMFVVSGALAADPLDTAQREELNRSIEQARPLPNQAVSQDMQRLISNFVMASIRRDALEASEDTEALGLAIQDRHRALSDLAFHAPVNVLELAAKLVVISEYAEDTERWANRAAAADAARLAGGSAK